MVSREGKQVGERRCFLALCYEVTLRDRDYGSVAEDLPNTLKTPPHPVTSWVTHTMEDAALISHPLQRYGPSLKDEASFVRTDSTMRARQGPWNSGGYPCILKLGKADGSEHKVGQL